MRRRTASFIDHVPGVAIEIARGRAQCMNVGAPEIRQDCVCTVAEGSLSAAGR
jgi:hypothetical protein